MRAAPIAKRFQASEETLAETIAEFGPNHEQTSIQAFGVGYAAKAAGDFAEAERRYSQSRDCGHAGPRGFIAPASRPEGCGEIRRFDRSSR